MPRCRGIGGVTNLFGSHEQRRREGEKQERGVEVILMKGIRVEEGVVMETCQWDGKMEAGSKRRVANKKREEGRF